MTYSDIPGNSVCTVVETQDGHTPTVGVARSGPSQVTIPRNDTATEDLTDTYETGDLVVDKLIDGDVAGHEGAITVLVSCTAPNGATTDLPNFDIAAGATGNQSNTYTGIAGGSTCTATESPDGTTSTVTLDTNGTIPQTVTVAEDGTGTADVSDTYSFVTADLTVNKTVAGSAAASRVLSPSWLLVWTRTVPKSPFPIFRFRPRRLPVLSLIHTPGSRSAPRVWRPDGEREQRQR